MIENKSYLPPQPVSNTIEGSRLSSEIKTQQKLAMIFNKADHIIKELNLYREKKSQSFYYVEETPVRDLSFVQVLELAIRPTKHMRGQSIGCQTESPSIGFKWQQNDQQDASTKCRTIFSQVNGSIYSRSYSRLPKRFCSTILVKEICLNSLKINEIKSRSQSRGISVVSQSPCKRNKKERSKPKIKLIRNDLKRSLK